MMVMRNRLASLGLGLFAALQVKMAMAQDAAAQALPGTAPDSPVLGQPWNKGLGFQLPASEVKHEMEWFHNYLLWIITAITIIVLLLMIYICVRYSKRMNPIPSKTSHNTLIEVIWTAIPVAILVAIAIPSFKLLYLGDRIPDRSGDPAAQAPITLKIIGHQWYWSYAFPEYKTLPFDSRMIPEADWRKAHAEGRATGPRLLAVDNPVLIPLGRDIRVLATSEDVIHAIAIPAFGLKKDAVPGRINETWFKATETGTFYGQCSELCGADHGYMPLAFKVVSQAEFDTWVAALEKDPDQSGEIPGSQPGDGQPAPAAPGSHAPMPSKTDAPEPLKAGEGAQPTPEAVEAAEEAPARPSEPAPVLSDDPAPVERNPTPPAEDAPPAAAEPAKPLPPADPSHSDSGVRGSTAPVPTVTEPVGEIAPAAPTPVVPSVVDPAAPGTTGGAAPGTP